MIAHDWSFLSRFAVPQKSRAPIWAPLTHWLATSEAVVAARRDALPALVAAWTKRLAHVGGDPSRRDWRAFRPLHHLREEGWSDWLAQLFEDSETGSVALALFGSSVEGEGGARWRRPQVRRELRTKNERRADLVLTEAKGTWVHVEVKLWDVSFDKTFDTAHGLETMSPGRWRHFILIPESNEDLWEACRIRNVARNIEVNKLTWRDVVVALRSALWRGEEDASWSVWAAACVGGIERRMLGIDHGAVSSSASFDPSLLHQATTWAGILDEAMREAEERT